MSDENTHPTSGRRRRVKGPPSSTLQLPRLDASDTEKHSDDSAGEKEAKRQRSEPTTPVSTHGTNPNDYDALMGITRVGTKEAEGFDKELDSPIYHDVIEEPTKKGELNTNEEQPEREVRHDVDTLPRLRSNQGGYGSSSLKECIELLNATANAPAPLDSGVGKPGTPRQVMSPSMDIPSTKGEVTTSSGSLSQVQPLVKEELQVKTELVQEETPKPEDCAISPEVKQEQKESETKEEASSSVKQEEQPPEPTQDQQEERPPEPDTRQTEEPPPVPNSDSDEVEIQLSMDERERIMQEMFRVIDARNRGIPYVPEDVDDETSTAHTTPRERESLGTKRFKRKRLRSLLFESEKVKRRGSDSRSILVP